MERMREGEIFLSYDDFKNTLDDYCTANKFVFAKKATKTVAATNKTLKKEGSKYPECWKYITALFQCKHYGSYESSSKGKRPVQETFRTGCGASFRLVASKPFKGLILKEVNLDHSNHPQVLTSDDASVYPEMRRLDKDQLEELEELISLKVNCRQLVDHFKMKYDIQMTDYDIHNHRARLKKTHNGDMTEEQLIDRLFSDLKTDDPGIVLDVVCDEDSITNIIFFQTSNMRRTLTEYPTVLFIDSTYKVNSRGMPLFNFMVVDGNQNGQTVAHALVVNERAVTVTKLLEVFYRRNEVALRQTATVVIDKDFSEIQAVRNVLPHAAILICKFHVVKAVQESLRGYSSQERQDVLTLLNGMLGSSTEAQYLAFLNDLKVKSPGFYVGFIKNWDSCKASWAGYLVRRHQTFGNLTNNFVESNNQKIKLVVNRQCSIPELFRELINLDKKKHSKLSLKRNKLSLKKVQVHQSNFDLIYVIDNIYKFCSPHAAKVMKRELEKFSSTIFLVEDNMVSDPNGKTYSVSVSCDSCSCFRSQCERLICCHIFAVRKDRSQELFTEADVPEHYRRDKYLQMLGGPVEEVPFSVSVEPQTTRQVLSKNDKFRLARRALLEACDVISEFGQEEFDANLALIKGILEAVKGGRTVHWFTDDIPITSDGGHFGRVQGSVGDFWDDRGSVGVGRPLDLDEGGPLDLDEGGSVGRPLDLDEGGPLDLDEGGSVGRPLDLGVGGPLDLGEGGSVGGPLDLDEGGSVRGFQDDGGSVVRSRDDEGSVGGSLDDGGSVGGSQGDGGSVGRSQDDGGSVGRSQDDGGSVGRSQDDGGSVGGSQDINFSLPSQIRTKGRPKGSTKRPPRKKAKTDELVVENIVKSFLVGGLHKEVLKGKILIDSCMFRDINDLPQSLSQCEPERLRIYFTHGGWKHFQEIISILRS